MTAQIIDPDPTPTASKVVRALFPTPVRTEPRPGHNRHECDAQTLIDRAAQLVHSDHDRAPWWTCQFEECVLLLSAYDAVGNPCDCD